MHGERDRVKVYRDTYGVPHIYANTSKGLFTTWGYVVGQDRLFQLEILRATVWGTVAELYGAGENDVYVEFDKQIRIMSYTEAEVNAEIAALDKEYRDILTYYADGVNMYIREALANPNEKLPYEYHKLGITPREFTAADIAQIFIGSMGLRYNDWNFELPNAAVYKKLEETVGSDNVLAAFNDAYPLVVTDILTTIPLDTPAPILGMNQPKAFCNHNLPDSITEVYKKEEQRLKILHEVLGGSLALPIKSGSYMWLVGEKTVGNEALYLNGPQMGHFVPGYVHEVGIHGAGYDAVGTSPTGYPFVQFGRNKHITWGSTAGLGDVVDIFILDLAGDDHHYTYKGQTLAMEGRTETINVKGETTVTINAYRSVYGPVFQWADGKAYTRKRSWKGKCLESLAGWIDSTKARNFEEFLAGASKMAISINWGYADDKGNIGYINTGRYPIRRFNVDGRLPVPGTGEYDWLGYHEFYAFNPVCINPEQGYLVNWNNMPSAFLPRGDFTYSFWNSYQRAFKICEEIDKRPVITFNDMKTIEKTIGFNSNIAETYKPYFAFHAADPPDARQVMALQYIADWDNTQTDNNWDYRYDSVGLTIWNAWYLQMMHDMLYDEFGDFANIGTPYDDWATPFFTMSLFLHQIQGPDSAVPLSRDYLNGVPLRDALLNSLSTVLANLETQFGSSDMSTWLSPVVPHAFARVNFNGVPANEVPVRDLHQFMNRGSQVHVMSMQRSGIIGENIFAPGNCAFVDPRGFYGPHYDDLLYMFEDYRGFKKMLFDKAEVRRNRILKFVLLFD